MTQWKYLVARWNEPGRPARQALIILRLRQTGPRD
jgi:hypothetical protein